MTKTWPKQGSSKAREMRESAAKGSVNAGRNAIDSRTSEIHDNATKVSMNTSFVCLKKLRIKKWTAETVDSTH